MHTRHCCCQWGTHRVSPFSRFEWSHECKPEVQRSVPDAEQQMATYTCTQGQTDAPQRVFANVGLSRFAPPLALSRPDAIWSFAVLPA